MPLLLEEEQGTLAPDGQPKALRKREARWPIKVVTFPGGFSTNYSEAAIGSVYEIIPNLPSTACPVGHGSSTAI